MTADNSPNPVFQDGSDWYFWDETWTMFIGPFESEEDATNGLQDYELHLVGKCQYEKCCLKGKLWHDGETGDTK